MPTRVEKKGDVWYLSDDLPAHQPVKARQTTWLVRFGAGILLLIGIGNLNDAPGFGVILILVALALFFRLTDRAEKFASGPRSMSVAGAAGNPNRFWRTLGSVLNTIAAIVSIITILCTLAAVAGVIFLLTLCKGMFNTP